MFTDISLRRESTCPVHFVWDGNGVGRPVVRLGFLLILITGTLMSAGLMFASKPTTALGLQVGIAAAVIWGVGQVLTRVSVAVGRRRGTLPARLASAATTPAS